MQEQRVDFIETINSWTSIFGFYMEFMQAMLAEVYVKMWLITWSE